MTPEEFVASVREGEVFVEAGAQEENGDVVSYREPLGADDPVGVTIAAMQAGAFTSDASWEEALQKISELLA